MGNEPSPTTMLLGTRTNMARMPRMTRTPKMTSRTPRMARRTRMTRMLPVQLLVSHL